MHFIQNTFEKLSINNVNNVNDVKLTIINVFYILGMIYTFFGMIITPYKLIHVYIFYLLTLIILQFILNDKSFIEDLMNHKNENEDTNDSSNNYKLFSILLGISLLSLIFSNVYPQNILKFIFNFLNDEMLHFLPLVLLYFWILIYLFVKLTKLKK